MNEQEWAEFETFLQGFIGIETFDISTTQPGGFGPNYVRVSIKVDVFTIFYDELQSTWEDGGLGRFKAKFTALLN